MLFAALLLSQATPLPELTIKALANGGLITASRFPASALDATIAKQTALAQAHCGRLKVRWGRFNTKQDYVPDASGAPISYYSRYEQKFSCFDPATDPYKPAPAEWQPSAAEKAGVQTFVQAHLAAMTRRDVKAASANFEPLLELTRPEAAAIIDDYRSRTDGQSLSIRGIVWLNNPNAAAHPGAYAYVIFDGARSCGYLLVYRAAPSRYQVSQFHVFGAEPGAQWTRESEKAMHDRCSQL